MATQVRSRQKWTQHTRAIARLMRRDIHETSSGRASTLISAEGVVVVDVLLLAGGETVVTLVTLGIGITGTGGGGGHRIGGGGAILDGC